jgi:hypothetical protein
MGESARRVEIDRDVELEGFSALRTTRVSGVRDPASQASSARTVTATKGIRRRNTKRSVAKTSVRFVPAGAFGGELQRLVSVRESRRLSLLRARSSGSIGVRVTIISGSSSVPASDAARRRRRRPRWSRP